MTGAEARALSPTFSTQTHAQKNVEDQARQVFRTGSRNLLFYFLSFPYSEFFVDNFSLFYFITIPVGCYYPFCYVSAEQVATKSTRTHSNHVHASRCVPRAHFRD